MNEIMSMDILNIDTSSEYPVRGRELHARLGIESNYTTWFNRMCGYGFEEGKDFKTRFPNLESELHGGQNKIDHHLTLSMAKEICMLQRTEQGREVRRYLIRVEEAWNSPDAIMARALNIANERVKALKGEVLHLQAKNSELTVQTQIMQPKADYFDELVDRGVNLNFRETAKELQLKEKSFVRFLIDYKYLYRDKKGKLIPYAQHADSGLFVIKECFNEHTNWGGIQTLITSKGREAFRHLMSGLREYS